MEIYPSQTSNMPEQTIQPKPHEIKKSGWICPKRGKGVAPDVKVCPCSNLVENVFVQN